MIGLEVVWSGALERQRLAPGLSSFVGHSQLVGAIKADPAPSLHARTRKPMTRPGSKDAEILVLLKKGVGYKAIGRTLEISHGTVRAVARRHGLESRWIRAGEKALVKYRGEVP